MQISYKDEAGDNSFFFVREIFFFQDSSAANGNVQMVDFARNDNFTHILDRMLA